MYLRILVNMFVNFIFIKIRKTKRMTEYQINKYYNIILYSYLYVYVCILCKSTFTTHSCILNSVTRKVLFRSVL